MIHTRGTAPPLESAIPTMLGGGRGEWLFWVEGDQPFEIMDCGDDSHSYIAKFMMNAPGNSDDFDDDAETLDYVISDGWVRGRFHEDGGSLFLQGQPAKVLAAARYLYDSGRLAIHEIIIDFATEGALTEGHSVALKGDEMMVWLSKGRIPKGQINRRSDSSGEPHGP
jgi:hypothetical protein